MLTWLFSSTNYVAGGHRSLTDIGGEQTKITAASPLAGSGISGTGTTVSNSKPSPAFAAISGGTTTTYMSSQLSSVQFNNCTHSFSSNLLTITPTVSAGQTLTAGLGIIIDAQDQIQTTKLAHNTRPLARRTYRVR